MAPVPYRLLRGFKCIPRMAHFITFTCRAAKPTVNSRSAAFMRDHRVSMYRDTWLIFVHHPWVGAGLWTLRTVYPRYASFYMTGVIVDHAHNDYLELLADTGIAGGLCGLAFMDLLFRQGFKNLQAAGGRFPRASIAGSLAPLPRRLAFRAPRDVFLIPGCSKIGRTWRRALVR